MDQSPVANVDQAYSGLTCQAPDGLVTSVIYRVLSCPSPLHPWLPLCGLTITCRASCPTVVGELSGLWTPQLIQGP